MAHWLAGRPHCPKCLATLHGASAVSGDAKPRPGDMSVCIYCASILQFARWKDDQHLKLQVVSEEELSKLPQEMQTQLKLARWAIQQVGSPPDPERPDPASAH